MAVWPEKFRVLRDNFQESLTDRTISSNMDIGPAKKRRRSLLASSTLTFSAVVSNEDYPEFRKFYFDNGKLRQELTIKDNIVVGDVKKYRIDGSLLATAIVENNKPISGICYHTDGRKRPLTESEIERVSRMDFDCD